MSDGATFLWAIVLLPLAGFVANGALALLAPGRRRAVSLLGPGVVGGAFLLALLHFLRFAGPGLAEPLLERHWSWLAAGRLQIEVAFQLDALSLALALVVTGVGFLIHVFSVGYMEDDPGYARYFAYLNLFVFFMLVLVLAANFPLMFVGWEGVGLCSYLLIGFWFRDREKADAGKKAFIVNRIGDVGFLVAMFLLFANLGTLDFREAFAAAPAAFPYGGPVVTMITLCLLLGATGKSAQIPLYVWLPDAMAGPTPVSALIHAATMVTAGVYMVARAGVLYALAPLGGAAVAGIGALTALLAATVALAQHDIKRVLAYSTISQLGYMFLGVGVGAFTAGIFHLVTHAFFKALLFLGAGAVIHALHAAYHHAGLAWDPQDMRNMGGLRRELPLTCLVMWVGTLAIAGVWPFAGFFSKDEILWQAAARAAGPYAGWLTLCWGLALLAALLTAVYMTRLMVLTFHGSPRGGPEVRAHLHDAPAVMAVPLVALAALSVVGGWINVPEAIARLPVLGWLPSSAWLHDWLHPVMAPAERILEEHLGPPRATAPLGGGEAAWAVGSTVLAAAVVLVTARRLARQAVRPAAESPAPTGFLRVLHRNWYVDELYQAVVVRPVMALARALWRGLDQGLIDGAVNGIARALRAVGAAGARLQTGQLNTYAYAIVIGALVLLGLLVL